MSSNVCCAFAGSAHTVLGSYWSKKLGKKKLLGKSSIYADLINHQSLAFTVVCLCVAYQCSGRGGELELEVRDDGRINIAGQTVTVLQGTITL